MTHTEERRSIQIQKDVFLFRGFWIMKTTFSYFPGMVENPAPVKYYSKKNEIKNIIKY